MIVTKLNIYFKIKQICKKEIELIFECFKFIDYNKLMIAILKKLLALAIFIMIFGSLQVHAAKKPVEIECEVKDGSLIVADVYYPNEKKQKYATIVLLHSLGYSSQRWSDFANSIADAGYLVVAIDLRGHGRSVYNSKLVRQSWANFKRSVFKKYPDDILEVLRVVKEEHPRASFEDWGIVGADIGANTAVLVAEKAKFKPKTLVLISPHESHKGLFIPIAIVNIGKIPILTISSENDKTCLKSQNKKKKYAQSDFVITNFKTNITGMLMLGANPTIPALIINWLEGHVAQYK